MSRDDAFRATPRLLLAWVLLTLPVVVPCEAESGASGDVPPPPSAAERALFLESKLQSWEAVEQARTGERVAHDDYDVLHYDVSLDLDIPARIVNGRVEVTAAALVSGLTQTCLDLYPCMVVSAVTVDGVPAVYQHAQNQLTVDLGASYEPGQTFSIACTYRGTPYHPGIPTPFLWGTHAGTPIVCSYSEPYGAPAWWLCDDDPEDKATFAIHVTCPEALVAVSNGRLDGVVVNGNGTRTHTWVTDYPMSTYLFSVAVTNFQSWTDTYTALDGVTTMDVAYYAYPEDLSDAQICWSNNVSMMEYFAGLFGEYPFLQEKYAIAEFCHSGAMEHQTVTSMGAQWVVPSHAYDWIVAHELSHSWVGDMITMNEWSHAWCKEGFATICEALYYESLYGLAYYHNYMRAMGVMTYANYQLYGIQPPLHGAIYYKGAWVLHMLRHVIGDEAFFDGIFAYTNDPGLMYGAGDTEDLRAAFESTSGLDLSWFFGQWIYAPGYPLYQHIWWSEPVAGGHDLHLTLRQTQTTGPVFKMPIDVRVTTAAGQQTHVVWDSLQTQHFTLHLTEAPLAVALDPDIWILRRLEEMSAAPVAAAAPRLELGPSPMRDRTSIAFGLEHPAVVRLEILDVAGRRVAGLIDGDLPAGPARAVWNGCDPAGRRVAPGLYFCRLAIDGATESRRILVMR